MYKIDKHTNTFAKTHNHGYYPDIDKELEVVIVDNADHREIDEFEKALRNGGLILSFTRELDGGSLYSLVEYTN